MGRSAFVLLLVAWLAVAVLGRTTAGRGNRMVDEKVSAMDEGTRRRILAMQQSGMPKEAIAKKIAFETGGEGTAKRIVDRINIDEKRRQYDRAQKHKEAVHRSTKSKR